MYKYSHVWQKNIASAKLRTY